MLNISFKELIAPLDPQDFFRDFWQKASFCGPTTGAVRDLVTLPDIEFLASSLTSTGPDWIQVVKAGARLAPQSFCTDESFVSLPKTYGAYQAGYTLQMAKLHKRWPPIGRLCRAVEDAFTAAGVPLAHRVGSHLYLTPADSVGFSPHYDSHDVIVVQVQGAKHWKVYGAMQEFPVAMQKGNVSRDKLPPLSHDVLLEAGQILYVPRGIFHEAFTEDQHSIHVTLDVFPYTWVDLVHRIMLAEPRFRESLPVGSWQGNGGPTGLAATFRERIEWLLGFNDLQHVSTEMVEEFLDNLDTLPDDGFSQLHQLDQITLSTTLTRRPGTFAHILANASGPKLRFPGSGFGGPAVLEPVFRFLETSTRFSVGDLPDFLSSESKLQIARELIREGFLEISEPA